MRSPFRQNRNSRNQERSSYRREDESSSRRLSGDRNEGGRSDWYDRDPMDDRSGYRDEDWSPGRYSRQMSSADNRGYNDHYRYDQNYHNYYGSTDYNPDRERDYEGRSRRNPSSSSYDSDRYSRGQGAYGSSSSDRSSWDTGLDTSSRYNENRYDSASDYTRRNWDRDESSREDRSEQSRGSYYGRGPKNFKRSDERIKEEVCEMLTRHSSIDADDIDVEVKEGEVTLTGSVSERRMKHLAEDCAEQCYGVKDVVNNIRVKRADEIDSTSDRTEFGSSRSQDRSSTTASSGKKTSSSSTSTQSPH